MKTATKVCYKTNVFCLKKCCIFELLIILANFIFKNKNMSIKKWEGDQKQTAIETIINRICEGESLRAILNIVNDRSLPSIGTFLRWVSEDETLRQQYTRAMEIRSDILFHDVIEISSDNSLDSLGPHVVQRSRLQVDTLKWFLGKVQPKKYGDKLDLTTDGEKIDSGVTIFQLPDNGRSED